MTKHCIERFKCCLYFSVLTFPFNSADERCTGLYTIQSDKLDFDLYSLIQIIWWHFWFHLNWFIIFFIYNVQISKKYSWKLAHFKKFISYRLKTFSVQQIHIKTLKFVLENVIMKWMTLLFATINNFISRKRIDCLDKKFRFVK